MADFQLPDHFLRWINDDGADTSGKTDTAFGQIYDDVRQNLAVFATDYFNRKDVSSWPSQDYLGALLELPANWILGHVAMGLARPSSKCLS